MNTEKGIRCPKCGGVNLESVKTRLVSGARERARRCLDCKKYPIWTTETPVVTSNLSK